MFSLTMHTILLIYSLIFISYLESISCKKIASKDLVETILDAKELKKLTRTKNNVLILFTKGGKESNELINIFTKTAEQIKGQATLAIVDCSGEAKKLCRKLKITPEPHVLKHYKDGEYHKDYERRHTVQSMVNFLKDPSGDLPWEEDERGKDVLHIPDSNTLAKLLNKEKSPIMIMFYAPWCGFCKRLKPEYESAAAELRGHSVLAAMDVNKPENAVIRQHLNITGFPTLLYFESGQLKHKYDGENNKDSIISFMKNPEQQPAKPKEEEWADTPSDVVHLTDDSFDSVLKMEPSALVMFYAPWCGHCKKMKPEYTTAASSLKDLNIPGILAAVDATKEKAIGDRFKVTGYPTVKYFRNGEFAFDVSLRTADKILDFMKDPKEPPPPPPPEVPWSDEISNVVHLTEEDFKPFLKRKKHVIVMFYAPWCGHCKKAKPEFQAAAEYFKDDTRVAFAAVDCTVQNSVCSAHDVKGFPTLKYFSYYKAERPYEGGRTESDFIEYMKSAAENLSPLAPEKFWSDIPNGHFVQYLKTEIFNEVIKSKESVLVMFYAPWSGHCKALKKHFADAAAKLQESKNPGILAAVDGTVETALAEQFEITAFPTVKYFRNGEYAFDILYRSADKIIDFMKDPKEPPPPPREIPWSEEPSSVVHLTDKDFTSFLKKKKHVLLIFYAPWCGHCKRAKPEFQAAAEYFKDESEVAFAALDCTGFKSICDAHDIKGYPTIKYFNHYTIEKPYESRRTESDFVEYMKSVVDGETLTTTTAPPQPPEKWWSDVPNNQYIQHVKSDSFKDIIKLKENVLIMFYAPWSAHCKALKKQYVEAAVKLKELKVDCLLAAVDGTVETSLASEFSIAAYPTLKYFRNGKLVGEKLERTANDIVKFMTNPSAKEEL